MLFRKLAIGLSVFVCGGFCATRAGAQATATGTISCQPLGPKSYNYTLTLSVDPASDDPVQSYWFAWIPGYDFLPSHPTSISSPAGWTAIDAPDTYGVSSIIWSDDAAPIRGGPIFPGQTLAGFSFITPDPPSALFDAYSNLTNPPTPVLESLVYNYPDVRGDATFIVPAVVPSAVPEPASLAIIFPAVLMLRRRRRHTSNRLAS